MLLCKSLSRNSLPSFVLFGYVLCFGIQKVRGQLVFGQNNQSVVNNQSNPWNISIQQPPGYQYAYPLPTVQSNNPFVAETQLMSGKCFVEVLTSGLVKPNSYVPPGNGSNPSVSIIETCCQGYQPYVHNKSLCIPHCTKPCINGFCVQPDICNCFPDHAQSLNGDCVPTCPIGCLNGLCHSDGTCFCNFGFIPEPNRKFCVPKCSQGCGHLMNCTGPELCTCIKGYKVNPSNRICEPICDPLCGNGICIAPGMCSCSAGFALISGTCQANCTKGCQGGRCIANEVCACDSGWVLDATGNRCIPYCVDGCANGKCTSPGFCTCNDGYKKVGTQCKPRCRRGCGNGICSAPSVCSCKSNYYFDSSERMCKRVREVVIYDDKSKRDPIYDPVVIVQPNPSPPIFHPPINSFPINPGGGGGGPIYPILPSLHPNVNAVPANPMRNNTSPRRNETMASLYQPPIHVETVKGPIINPPLANNRPSSEYDKQPAFNPFFQKETPVPSSNQKPNYLEPQPAFNPFFNTPKPRTSTTRPTTKRHRHENLQTTHSPRQKVHRNPLNAASRNTTHKSEHIRTTTAKSNHPTCQRTCLNGRCTSRNHCTCNHGYTKATGSDHKCIPDCGNKCNHGHCIAPDLCTCNVGYKKRNGKCVKI